MAETRGRAGAGYRLPSGTYRGLIERERRADLREDPRQYLTDDEAELARLREADVQARVKAAELTGHDVAAARPIVVQAWRLSGRARSDPAAPGWLTTPAIYGGAATVRVYPGDTCEPASF